MRPGYLGTIGELCGKDFEPSPGPPPPGSPKSTVTVPDAINKKTGKYYLQNTKCPPGERMLTCGQAKHSPVAGCGPVSECCDIIFGPPFCIQDCGPDVPSGECDDDPNFVEFPDGAWKTCAEVKAAFKAAGIPESFANSYCESEDVPDKLPPPRAPTRFPQQTRPMTRQVMPQARPRPPTKEEMVSRTIRARETRARAYAVRRKKNVGYDQPGGYSGLGSSVLSNISWKEYALVGVVGLLLCRKFNLF